MKKPEEAKNTADFKKEEAEQPELKPALNKKKLVVNKINRFNPSYRKEKLLF